MKNLKLGLINCFGAVCSVSLLVLLIVFSSISGSIFNIISYTLFGSFILLYFIFSILYNWIGNETCQNIFKRFLNIFKILGIYTAFIILVFSNISQNLKWILFGFATIISCMLVIFSAIWKKIPDLLLSLISIFTHIALSIILIFIVF